MGDPLLECVHGALPVVQADEGLGLEDLGFTIGAGRWPPSLEEGQQGFPLALKQERFRVQHRCAVGDHLRLDVLDHQPLKAPFSLLEAPQVHERPRRVERQGRAWFQRLRLGQCLERFRIARGLKPNQRYVLPQSGFLGDMARQQQETLLSVGEIAGRDLLSRQFFQQPEMPILRIPGVQGQ